MVRPNINLTKGYDQNQMVRPNINLTQMVRPNINSTKRVRPKHHQMVQPNMKYQIDQKNDTTKYQLKRTFLMHQCQQHPYIH